MSSLPRIGDHLVSRRFIYTHHGLYAGRDRVIHYSGNARPGVSGPVEEVSIQEFAGGRGFWIKDHPNRKHSRDEAVARARKRIGENNYDLAANNCEHFVEWCIEGDHTSPQVNVVAGVGTGALSALGTGAGIGAVSAGGLVAGLSAPGMMSGLASIGGVVGGGAVAGIASVAAAPAALSAFAVSKTLLKDNPALEQEERDARHYGRIGAGVGVVAATAGGVAAVSTMGATAGLSAAGITSGLAALGSMTGASAALSAGGVAGGAMVGGIAVAAAAPAVITALAGYGVYLGAKWLTQK